MTYNVFLGTALAYFLFVYAIDKLPAGIAGMGTLCTPIIGVLAAWLQLGDVPGLYEAMGIVLILSGLAVLTWRQLRSDKPAPVRDAADLERSRMSTS